jgi:hypothetical protein
MNNDFIDADGKPRVVCVGGVTSKSILIPLMGILNYGLKKCLPSFIQAMLKGQIEKTL